MTKTLLKQSRQPCLSARRSRAAPAPADDKGHGCIMMHGGGMLCGAPHHAQIGMFGVDLAGRNASTRSQTGAKRGQMGGTTEIHAKPASAAVRAGRPRAETVEQLPVSMHQFEGAPEDMLWKIPPA